MLEEERQNQIIVCAEARQHVTVIQSIDTMTSITCTGNEQECLAEGKRGAVSTCAVP